MQSFCFKLQDLAPLFCTVSAVLPMRIPKAAADLPKDNNKSFAASRVSKRSSFICHLFGQTFASTFHPSSSSFLSPLTATCGQSTVGEKKGQSNIDIPHISPFPLLLFQRHRLIIINNITIIWSSSTSSSTSSWSSYSSRLNFQLSSQLTFACVLRHISALSASLLLQLQLTTLIHQYQRP